MKTIDLKEIEKLYSAYNVKFNENHLIRNTLNKGSMNNKLNCDYSFMHKQLNTKQKEGD